MEVIILTLTLFGLMVLLALDRFTDHLKSGLPLSILYLAGALFLIPIFWPF